MKAHPFNPPASWPEMKKRWATKNSASMGIDVEEGTRRQQSIERIAVMVGVSAAADDQASVVWSGRR